MNKLICLALAVSLTSCSQATVKPKPKVITSEVKVSYTTGLGDVKVVADTPFLVSPNCQDLNPNKVGNSYENYQSLKEVNQADTYHTNSEGKFTVNLVGGSYCISNIWIPTDLGDWYNHSGNNKVGGCYISYRKQVTIPSETLIELQGSDVTRASCY